MNFYGLSSSELFSIPIPSQQPEAAASGVSESTIAVKTSTEEMQTASVRVKIVRSMNFDANVFAHQTQACPKRVIASLDGVPFYEYCTLSAEDGEHTHQSMRIEAFPSDRCPIPTNAHSVTETAINLSTPEAQSLFVNDPSAQPKNPPSADEFTIQHISMSMQPKPTQTPCYSHHLVETAQTNVSLHCQVISTEDGFMHIHETKQVKNINTMNKLISPKASMSVQEFAYLTQEETTSLQTAINEVKEEQILSAIAGLFIEERQEEASLTPQIKFASSRDEEK